MATLVSPRDDLVVITDALLVGRRGLATRVLDAPPGRDLPPIAEGVLLVDRSGRRLWVRVGGEWRYAQLR